MENDLSVIESARRVVRTTAAAWRRPPDPVTPAAWQDTQPSCHFAARANGAPANEGGEGVEGRLDERCAAVSAAA